MKVFEWSLQQQIIFEKDRRIYGSKPFGHDWTLHSYYCKKCGQLIPKGTEVYSNGNHRPLCPVHRQLLRHKKQRTKGMIDNRWRVDL